MRLVSYFPGSDSGAGPRSGVVLDGSVFDVTTLLGSASSTADASVMGLLRRYGGDLRGLATRLARRASSTDGAHRGSLADLRLGPPVPNPSKMLCIGLNYRLHAEETGRHLPTHPDVFSKFDTSLIGPRDDIAISHVSDQVDFEGELAVVIGRTARGLSREDALGAVAGVTVLNDISARDLQWRGTQWLPGKAVDASTPCGPALVSLDEIPDLQNLSLTTRVNGTEVQHSNTSLMIFDVASIVAYVSHFLELRPGDVIATGTPEGIGAKRQPPLWLRPGDQVEVEVEGVGTVRNAVR